MDATTPIPPKFACTIHALPLELLVTIFLHLYNDPTLPRAGHDLQNSHKLTFVMLVCRAWRDIVEWAPILWTDIWLGQCPRHIEDGGTGQWVDHIKTRFRRSGMLLFNLTIMAAYVDLVEVSPVFLQHISRCKTLALRALKDEADWTVHFSGNTSSILHRILSSPLPAVQTITIEEFAYRYEPECHLRALMLDAPNLRELTSLSPHITPFVKPQSPPLSTDHPLERFSILVAWENILPKLPRDRLFLPNLKFFSVAYIDHLWNLLHAIDIPSVEHLVINCGLAEWPKEVVAVVPMMNNLRQLEWYTDMNAVDEDPNLRHLLQLCPNIISFSYICNDDSVESLKDYLEEEQLDDPVLASSSFLTEMQGGVLRFCPKLRRLSIACASFDQVRELVLLRPMLEHVSLQSRKPGDDIVTSSEATWLAKVTMVCWIRSKIQFEFPVAVGLDLREEEGVVWDPNATLIG